MTRDLFNEAARALLAHRLRASLSIIGIVFGVATVVTAIAIGQGARDAAIAEIGGLGIDNVFIRATLPRAVGRAAAIAPSLTRADARTLAAAVPSVTALAVTRTSRGEIVGPHGRLTTTLAGVSASWLAIGHPAVAHGRWLLESDERARRRVAVIGAEAARRLFGTTDPIGARVAAGGSWFVVVGRLAESARSTPSTLQRIDAANAVFVPIEAMDVSLGEGDVPDRVDEIALGFSGAEAVEQALAIVPAVLARRQVEVSRYEIVAPRALLNARLRAQRTFNVVLLAIGALALVISGVGIMNIMLASVVERTQEIGVRRAFGATRHAVIVQFAAEAALLCSAGGLAGVPLGWVFAALVASFAGWPTTISPIAIAIALSLALSVGLAFGIYPARLAASIDPAEALRAP